MYKIDVPTYHWDNDEWELEVKTLHFAGLDVARKAKNVLLDLEYSEDELLQHWSLPEIYRNKRTHDIPMSNDRSWIYDRVDVWHGVIIEAEFRIYTVVNMIQYVE